MSAKNVREGSPASRTGFDSLLTSFSFDTNKSVSHKCFLISY